MVRNKHHAPGPKEVGRLSRTYENEDIWHSGIGEADLMKMRRTLAKRANQRILRLERHSDSVTGESVDYGAISKAKNYLAKQGRNRFSESKSPKNLSGAQNLNALKREIGELQNFLKSKSSTVGGYDLEPDILTGEAVKVKTGIESIIDKRQQAFLSGVNQKTGAKRAIINIADKKSFYRFLNDASFEKLSRVFSSDKIIEIYQREFLNRKTNKSMGANLTIQEIEDAFTEYSARQHQSEKDLNEFLAGKRQAKLKKKRG